jgi:hypothetical protein
MAGETLRTASELLGQFPDNTSGLIEAVDSRDFIVSATVGVGFLEDDPAQVPYTIPLVDGVPVDFLGTLVAPLFAGNFWKLDGNNRFIPSYLDFGITVPPGTQRLVDGSVILNVQKDGNATPVTYQFQGTEGGVLTGEPVTREISNVPQTIVTGGTRLYDINVGGAISFNVQPVGHSEDLIVNDVRVAVTGVML